MSCRRHLKRFLVAATLVVACKSARAQDASLTVYLKNTGVGNFGQTNSLSSQVHVFAQSGFQAQYNGSPNIYAPAFGTAPPNTSFSVTVPNLTSANKQSFNNYFLNLDWPDTQHQMVQFGPFKLVPGNNNYGAGGLGSIAPIGVANMAPPAVTNPMCYADFPSPSTQLYTYWTFGWPNRFEDFNVTEVHMSTMQGFTPSQQNLIALNPYGTDYRKVSNLMPNTNYYFCVRVYDEYNAYSDTCFGPCKTAPAPDMAMMPVDMSMMATPDMAMMPVDMTMMAPPDLTMMSPPDMTMMVSPDLAMTPDLATTLDLAMANPDLAMTSSIDLSTPVNDLSVNMAVDVGTAGDSGAMPMDAGFDGDVDALIGMTGGRDVGGCGCSLRSSQFPRGAFIGGLLFSLLLIRRRRRAQ